MEFELLWQLQDPLISKYYAFPINSSGQLLEFRNRKSYCDQPIVLAPSILAHIPSLAPKIRHIVTHTRLTSEQDEGKEGGRGPYESWNDAFAE